MALPLEDNKNDAASPADDSRIKGNLPPKVKHMLDSVLHELMARPNVFGAAIGERIDITEASIVPKVEESSRSEARVVCEVTVAEGPSARPSQNPRIRLTVMTLLYSNFTSDAMRARLLLLLNPTQTRLDMLNPEGSLHGGCAAFLIDAYVSPPTPLHLFAILFSCCLFAQVHHARVPCRRPLCWCLGNHEHRIPCPRSPVRKKHTYRCTLSTNLTNFAVVSGAKLRIVNSAIAMGARIMSARSEARFLLLWKIASPLKDVVIAADLGRYRQATMCYWCPHQDGAVCPKAKAKVVDSYIPCNSTVRIPYSRTEAPR
jgi:hypothetical protein